MGTRVGIYGVGMYLPAEVRRNDWWPADVIAQWRPPAAPGDAPVRSSPMTAVAAAMARQANDPFQGSRERRVMDTGWTVLDMEEHAARAALDRAGIEARQIDLLLTCTTPSDYQLTNSACALHERLGLPTACFTLHTDGAQHAFLLQLTLAEAMLVSGQARHALLVQSSAISRLLDYRSPLSPLFGDGATAVVVGRVTEGRGILGVSHRTDGRIPNALIASVPGHAWYEPGRAILHLADPVGMRDILLRTVEVSREGIEAALASAECAAADVDVFAMHQGMPWLRELVQQHAGLDDARSVDTFADTGHLFAAFVPSTLAIAETRGVLGDGDVVVIAGGGNGMTYGAAVVRWGR